MTQGGGTSLQRIQASTELIPVNNIVFMVKQRKKVILLPT